MILKFSTLSKVALLAALLSACTPSKYNETPGVNKWRLVSFGDQKMERDSVALIFINGEVYIKDGIYPIQTFYSLPVYPAADPLWSVLRTRFPGDSLEYFSYSADLLHPDSLAEDTLHYFLYIDRMRTAEQMQDLKRTELVALDSIARSDTLAKWYTEYKGIYFRSLEPGDTARVRVGKELVLHYRGSTLSGKIFDDSRRINSPFRFVLGNELQVLPGIAIALEKMHLHEKARVIIPSWLAFGSEGSADHRVPPYTPVIYHLEVMQLGE